MDLYPYQQTGASFLMEHARAYLADEMGLGKCAQAVTAARRLGITRAGTLIVCPASVVPTWPYEWALWGGTGEPEVVSYTTLARDPARYAMNRRLVILDEAHYAKSPTAKRTRASLRVAAMADRAWLLSGTPMPNHTGELFAPVRALWPDVCERHGATRYTNWLYEFNYVRMTKYGPRPYAVRNGKVLRAELQRFMLRRRLEDVGLELPPLRVHGHRLPQDPTVKAALEASGYADMEADEEAYTSVLRRLLGEAKAGPIAAQIADELEAGAYQKIVVLYYHHSVRDILRERLAIYDVVGFDGSTPQGKRQEAIDAFQTGTARVFLAQQQSAGVGITLTAASEIVLVEPAWSPDDNIQAIKRIHRIGQDAPCRARIFMVSGTLDEAVMGTALNKLRMRKEVID
jgi:SWI/SNF-related matrix-associated actin-dependent regulator of chromatin subfamily A-like protein 1